MRGGQFVYHSIKEKGLDVDTGGAGAVRLVGRTLPTRRSTAHAPSGGCVWPWTSHDMTAPGLLRGPSPPPGDHTSLPYPPALPPAAVVLLHHCREAELPPDVLLLVFLSLLLYWESVTTSLRAIRRDLRAIVLAGTVLVAITAWAVAALAHAYGLPWGAASALGAAVAPTDARSGPYPDQGPPMPLRVAHLRWPEPSGRCTTSRRRICRDDTTAGPHGEHRLAIPPAASKGLERPHTPRADEARCTHRHRRPATTERILYSDLGAPMTFSHVPFAAARPILPTGAGQPRPARPSGQPDGLSRKSALSQHQYCQNPLTTATDSQDHDLPILTLNSENAGQQPTCYPA